MKKLPLILRRWFGVALASAFLLMPSIAITHPQSLVPGSQGAGFIPHQGGPYMSNTCAQGYWEAAKKTMQIFSAPLPLIYEDAYFDYLIYQGYIAAVGGAKPPGDLVGAIGAIIGGGGLLGFMPGLPAACFPTG